MYHIYNNAQLTEIKNYLEYNTCTQFSGKNKISSKYYKKLLLLFGNGRQLSNVSIETIFME